jgi:hypothetical protein
MNQVYCVNMSAVYSPPKEKEKKAFLLRKTDYYHVSYQVFDTRLLLRTAMTG